MKIEKEKRIVKLMIEIYAKKKMKLPLEQNNEMKDLLNYCYLRLSKCPFKDNKKFCSKCKIHCYKDEYRNKIKEVMRFSGPRLLIYHPILVIKHILERG
ncbi:MAG: nitrous oxide-stimulated promoter family protein [Bacilli bacterium]|nr:nitrous oxide-stimulated promoter family protein [Bacilli bacterium]